MAETQTFSHDTQWGRLEIIREVCLKEGETEFTRRTKDAEQEADRKRMLSVCQNLKQLKGDHELLDEARCTEAMQGATNGE